MDHRREIDGLRAVAVVPVIFFHAGLQAFTGGFVGVDVFFVISGYLITSIILTEQLAGTFTFAKFYERRARRILPALFVVMLACLPFAWVWLLPADMKRFSQSLVAVSAFASNFLFWRTGGYFESAAELKPLLHTWSLAVEEQYYLLFPPILIFALRWGRRWAVALFVTLACLSLFATGWGSIADPSATFYLLPTRAWELLIGVFVGFYLSSEKKPGPDAAVSELGSVIGLLLIGWAVFAFDRETPSPSQYTLFPTIGAALIIILATPQTVVGKMLGHKVFVGAGLLSYSAYLWHQPILAFARYRGLGEPTHWLFGALAIAAFVPAYFSWKFVERPFRIGRRITRGELYGYSAAASGAFVIFGITGIVTNGFEDRIGQEQREFLAYFQNDLPDWQYYMKIRLPERYRNDCNFYDVAQYRLGNPSRAPLQAISTRCFERAPDVAKSVFIWGDSHAQQLYYGLQQTLPDDWQILQVATSGCFPRLDATPNRKDYCEFSNWFALSKIVETRPQVVIIGQDLGYNVARMDAIAQRLQVIGVQRVIFTGPNPHWTTDLPNVVAFRVWDEKPRRTFIGVDRGVLDLDGELKSQLKQSSFVRYVSLIDYFCNNDGCLVYYGDDLKEGITCWDYAHLTPIASYHFAKDVLAWNVTEGFE